MIDIKCSLPGCENMFLPKNVGSVREKKYCGPLCHSRATALNWKLKYPEKAKVSQAKSDKKRYDRIKGDPQISEEYRFTVAAEGMERNRNYPERRSVASHYNYIFVSKSPSARTYKGMPFFEEWDPSKGGSFRAAEKWIIENIGRRPDGASLHIVKHGLGFVPGNMEWATKKKQIAEQMFKIIANQENRIKELEKEVLELQDKLDGSVELYGDPSR